MSLIRWWNWSVDPIYNKLFKDGSGTISPEELLGVLIAMGQNTTEDELLNLVMEVDIDGNGTIEFEEFLSMMEKKASETDEEAEADKVRRSCFQYI